MSRTTSTPGDPSSVLLGALRPGGAEPSTDGGEGDQQAPAIVGPIHRRRLDTVLVAFGALVAIVLAVAGGLLLWGHNFADDYVSRELSSQHITFPDAATLHGEGRTDLVSHAGQQVTTGSRAQAYASYIAGHLDKVANGETYADLGQPERAAQAAAQAAVDNGSPQATVNDLQAKADTITAQRNTLFKGDTLRGLLLSTYAWGTIARIAGIAALAAFVAAAVMVVLVVLGLVHRHRTA
jgi:hypothetical protein